MTKDQIVAARMMALQFLTVSQAAYRRIEEDSLASITGCKETGACRRASMDLTRALADLRRAG